MTKHCACDSNLSYDACCGRFLSGKELPKTALELMRSRYTAFTEGRIDYIKETRHPLSEGEFDEKSVTRWSQNSTWLGFETIAVEAGAAGDEGGKIEFVAKYRLEGRQEDHHEVALFQKYQGRWYFMDGDFAKVPTFHRETPKVGRNEPCPCGSGKKYKKCCG